MGQRPNCPSVSNYSTASTYAAGSTRTSDSGTPNSQTPLLKNSSRDEFSHLDQNGFRSTRSRSKSINNSLNWSNNSNDGGSTCDTISVAISEMPDIHHQPPGSPDQHLIKRKDLMERMGMSQKQEAFQPFRGSRTTFPHTPIRWTNSASTPPLTPKTNRRLQEAAQSKVDDPRCNCSHDQGQVLAYGNYDVPKATRSSEAMQLYDTPKSVKQGTRFLGPYANYDIPHPGENPVPVFRKACGCLMKLVPVSSNGCKGGSTSVASRSTRMGLLPW